MNDITKNLVFDYAGVLKFCRKRIYVQWKCSLFKVIKVYFRKKMVSNAISVTMAVHKTSFFKYQKLLPLNYV